MRYTLDLPFPPSANRYWRNWQGRMVKSDWAREYQVKAGWCAKVAGAELIGGDVAMELRLYRPQRRGDTDNYLKILIDALQGICYTDDSQVVELHAFLADDKHNPRVEVTIWETNT